MSLFSSEELSLGWEFRPTYELGEDGWMPVAKIPTVVHLDLMANKRIPDTSCDKNELAARWVDEESWSYRCEFLTPATTQRNGRVALVFEGLDTFAKVRLNGELILETANMFIHHHVEITAKLWTNFPNKLVIDFESAKVRGKLLRDKDSSHQYLASLGSSERLAVRKAQYHWGWDWGPTFITAGPWRPVRLETYKTRLEGVSIQYTLEDDMRSCRATISTRLDGQTANEVRIILRNPKHQQIFETTCISDTKGLAETTITLNNPLLWFPHGYGEQHRYELDVELMAGHTVLQLMTKKVSFRRAELIQEADKYGTSFYFRINRVDVFAGGSCWIPADSFTPRLSKESYTDWLTLMIEGNQIMIRVWGGGIYEEDIFYEACDELGILVWQDFMFACGSYPVFPDFLESVEAEARSNVRRLRHHPSVVLYAGGNENYYIQELHGLEYNYDDDKVPKSWLQSTFPSRYIYEHLLPKVVAEESPDVRYHTDSPWGGGKPILDVTIGDIHQWEVWHGPMRPYQEYGQIGGRFNSEFGMQSFPHLHTVDQFISQPLEKHPQSSTMNFHNKCKSHERRLATYVHENFRVLNSSLKNWIYLTQLLQSEAMHYAYRCWRRQWGSTNTRECGGALVWQLNDCWPATSWALVDYFLVKKPAFYTVKRDLSPLAVSVLRKHDKWNDGHETLSTWCTYDIWVATDGSIVAKHVVNAEHNNFKVEVRFISIRTGKDVLAAQRWPIDALKFNGTTVVCQGLQAPNLQGQDAFIIVAKLLVDGCVVSCDVDWPQPYKFISFAEDRALQVRLVSSRTRIEITALRPTKGLTFAERPGLHFSDNGFDVIPGDQYVVDVQGLEEDERLEWFYLGMNEQQGTSEEMP